MLNVGDLPPEFDVSRETRERLEIYSALLIKWNRKINLVAPGTISEMWSRHIIDSIQLNDLSPQEQSTWCDLGAGAGLPGLPVAAIRQEKFPDEVITLIDSDTRKAAFMSEAAREMGVNARILTTRLGKSYPAVTPFDIVSARALAPLPRLLEYAAPFTGPDTVCLFPKGKNRSGEIEEASRSWQMDLEEVLSRSDENGAILRIRGLKRV